MIFFEDRGILLTESSLVTHSVTEGPDRRRVWIEISCLAVTVGLVDNQTCPCSLCVCPNYVTLIMLPNCTIYAVCRSVSIEELCACSLSPLLPPHPPSVFFLLLAPSLPPSLHVGSSLRLHFSCLGSLLSSPANKSSANLLPESLCPCSYCSSPPLLGNTAEEEGPRESEQASERRRRGGWVEALPNGHPLCRNNRLLSLSVFQRAGAFHPPQVSPQRLTEHYCEAGEETYKRWRTRKKMIQ